MADLILIEPGSPPWEPSSDARLLDTYHFYDRPLIGLIEQNGMLHLFWCIAGEIEPWNLWGYIRIDPDERAELETGSFGSTFDAVTAGRPVTLSLAHDGDGIIAGAYVEHPDQIPEALETMVWRLYHDGRNGDLLRLLRTTLKDSDADLVIRDYLGQAIAIFQFKTSATGALGASRGQETWYEDFQERVAR